MLIAKVKKGHRYLHLIQPRYTSVADGMPFNAAISRSAAFVTAGSPTQQATQSSRFQLISTKRQMNGKKEKNKVIINLLQNTPCATRNPTCFTISTAFKSHRSFYSKLLVTVTNDLLTNKSRCWGQQNISGRANTTANKTAYTSCHSCYTNIKN